ILESFLDDMDKLPDDPEGSLLSAAVRPTVDKLAAFNQENADAVLEPEEKEELTELIHSASAATGADDEALAQLPELDF
ncbi:hypothetical protein, partial [Escherichia coli]